MNPSPGYLSRGAAIVACGALLPLWALAFAGGCAAPEKGEAQTMRTQAAERPADAAAATMAKADAEGDAATPQQGHCPTPKIVNVERHTPANGALPQLAIASETSEAPPVWPSQQTKHTFKLSNTGQGSLHIRLKGG